MARGFKPRPPGGTLREVADQTQVDIAWILNHDEVRDRLMATHVRQLENARRILIRLADDKGLEGR